MFLQPVTRTPRLLFTSVPQALEHHSVWSWCHCVRSGVPLIESVLKWCNCVLFSVNRSRWRPCPLQYSDYSLDKMCHTISNATSASLFSISVARGDWRHVKTDDVWAKQQQLLCIVNILSLCVGFQTLFKKYRIKWPYSFIINDGWRFGAALFVDKFVIVNFSLCSRLHESCTSKKMYIFACAPRFIPIFPLYRAL